MLPVLSLEDGFLALVCWLKSPAAKMWVDLISRRWKWSSCDVLRANRPLHDWDWIIGMVCRAIEMKAYRHVLYLKNRGSDVVPMLSLSPFHVELCNFIDGWLTLKLHTTEKWKEGTFFPFYVESEMQNRELCRWKLVPFLYFCARRALFDCLHLILNIAMFFHGGAMCMIITWTYSFFKENFINEIS